MNAIADYIFFSAMIASTKKMMIRKQYMNVLTCKITSLVHSRKYIKLYLNKVNYINYKYKHRCLKPAKKKKKKNAPRAITPILSLIRSNTRKAGLSYIRWFFGFHGKNPSVSVVRNIYTMDWRDEITPIRSSWINISFSIHQKGYRSASISFIEI